MSNKLTVSDYKLFCINEKKYIYNIISGSIFEIDELVMWILSCNGMPINEFKETVEKRDVELSRNVQSKKTQNLK